jgi:hypothetical protein
MVRNNYRIASISILVLLLSSLATVSQFNPARAELGHFNLMFLLSIDSPQYSQDLQLFSQFLDSGDYLLIHDAASQMSNAIGQAQIAQSMVKPGVHVEPTMIYDKISNLAAQVPNLPKGVTFVFYDYENGTNFSPEFTTNETVSIGYFDQAENAVQQYNAKTGGTAKLIVAPSYGELKNAHWDWGLAAKHMDAIDVQFGGYTKYPSLFLYAPQVFSQIKLESPGTPVFIELSLLPNRSTPQITANDIYTLDGKGVNGFLPWYNQTSSNHTLILQQFFGVLPRSVPPLPTNLTATTTSSSQINLSWSAPANCTYCAITGYKIERSTNNGTTWNVFNTTSNATAYSSTKLVHSTTYWYRVSAINQMGSGLPSNVTTATTFNAVPLAPTGLNATVVSSFQINLSWNAPVDNGGSSIIGYKINRSINNSTTWDTIVANTGNTTTYNDTGLSPNTNYRYHVFAINSIGTSLRSNTASATTPSISIVPQPPTGLVATAISSSQINLRWSAPSNNGGPAITGYEIERSQDNASTWSVAVSNTSSTATTYNDTGLSPSTTYTYRVSAINSVGASSPSGIASATSASATVPQSPTSLTANTTSSSQINLSWTAPANNGGSQISGYQIERSTDSGSTWSVPVPNTGSVSTMYSDAGLAHSTTYTYRVSAINSIGASSPSNTSSATTFNAVPLAPTGLNATVVSPFQINLSWNAPIDNGGLAITGYQIERSMNHGTTWSTSTPNTGNTTTYNDTGLSSSTTYSYRVSAINSAGTSPPSNTAYATTGNATVS